MADRKRLLADEEQVHQAEQSALADTSYLREEMTKCGQLVESIAAQHATLESKKQLLLKTQVCTSMVPMCTFCRDFRTILSRVQFLLETRQVKLLSELQAIYPIEQMDSGEHCIRGLELPVDLMYVQCRHLSIELVIDEWILS